jgi:transcriptional repressor NrdR
MKCPYCGETKDRVVDSREVREGATIRRRRQCAACGRRFTSYERIEDIPYMVVKNDGNREEFDRGKLLSGLHKACEKRPVPGRRLIELVDAVEQQLHERNDREMSTREIGEIVRFASVYRKFEDIGEFLDELNQLRQRRPEDR